MGVGGRKEREAGRKRGGRGEPTAGREGKWGELRAGREGGAG